MSRTSRCIRPLTVFEFAEFYSNHLAQPVAFSRRRLSYTFGNNNEDHEANEDDYCSSLLLAFDGCVISTRYFFRWDGRSWRLQCWSAEFLDLVCTQSIVTAMIRYGSSRSSDGNITIEILATASQVISRTGKYTELRDLDPEIPSDGRGECADSHTRRCLGADHETFMIVRHKESGLMLQGAKLGFLHEGKSDFESIP